MAQSAGKAQQSGSFREQMKKDPDYEAWVLDYTTEERSVHNPWASMPGYSPHYHTERFGASIEEHLGQSSQELFAEQLEKAKALSLFSKALDMPY